MNDKDEAGSLAEVAARAPSAFRSSEDVHPGLAERVRQRFGSSSARIIGRSEEDRPIYGFRVGTGEINVSLIAGNHADEPVGPETLRCLLDFACEDEVASEMLRRFSFWIVPHSNPDGEARNRQWVTEWPDLAAYLKHAVREQPGRDVEFGYPDLRPENVAVSAFLSQAAPIALHMSLHGMAFSTGALLLIDRRNAPHADAIRATFRAAAVEHDLGLHDENRFGEKGFFYLGPGFWTTPEGDAMRTHFEMIGDREQARCFRSSSMELVDSLGGYPLSLVTELPLFLTPLDGSTDEVMMEVRRLRAECAGGRLREEQAARSLTAIGTHAVPICVGMRMQLIALEAGLAHLKQKIATV